MKQFFALRKPPLWILLLLLLYTLLAMSATSCSNMYTDRGSDTPYDYSTYVPPDWAPPYDNAGEVRYYYLPDYDMYYDVWDRQYYYLNGGQWVASYELPAMYAGIPLSSSFVVLINRDVDRPWRHHDFYARNYPHHSQEHSRDIVGRNRIIANVRPEHELTPRPYNENNGRATFIQHPQVTESKAPETKVPEIREQQNRIPESRTQEINRGKIEPNRAPGQSIQRQPSALAAPKPFVNPSFHQQQQAHEMPMRSIAPSRPQESRKFNFGGSGNKAPRPALAPAPRQGPPPGRPVGRPDKK